MYIKHINKSCNTKVEYRNHPKMNTAIDITVYKPIALEVSI